MPPISLASEHNLTRDSDVAGETQEGCCIIHDLLLDTNWAALHSQIQSEAAAEMICWSRGQAPWLGWRKTKSRGRGNVWRAWETPLYRCSMMVEGHVMCMCMCMCPLVHASTFVAVLCFMGTALAAWEMLHFGPRHVLRAWCLEILHPETHTCAQQLWQTLTNCPLTSSNSAWHNYHVSQLPISLLCPSCPNKEMSMAASKQANNDTSLHQHLHHDVNTVSPKPAFNKYNRAVAQHKILYCVLFPHCSSCHCHCCSISADTSELSTALPWHTLRHRHR